MSQKEAYNRMIMSLTRSVMLLMSIAVVVFVFTSASDAISNTNDKDISAISFPTDGAILGSIVSTEDAFSITFENETNSFKKQIKTNGDYFIKGIKPGQYDVTIQSISEKDNFTHIEDVKILKGEVTALGTNKL